MRLTKDISDRLSGLIKPVTEEAGLELVDILLRQDKKSYVLDIVIDREDGITVDDCAVISEKVSLLLDVEDLFQHSYTLEVGSPGIFRELKKENDFRQNIGKRIKARFRNPEKGQKQFIGVLKAYKDQSLVVSNETHEIEVALTNLRKIQLYPDV